MGSNGIMTLLFAYFVIICKAQKIDLWDLNLQVNRLSRTTDVLQKDVGDIWAKILRSSIVTQNSDSKTSRENIETDASDLVTKINETFTDMQELKAEVEDLVQYSRNGLKDEKMWLRDIIKNLTLIQQKFQANLTQDTVAIKARLERSELMIRDVNKRLNETRMESMQYINAQTSNLLENHTLKLTELEINDQQLKQTISEIQKENQEMKENLTKLQQTAVLNTCTEGWKRFNHHCYQFKSRGQNWQIASAICKSKNSYLAELTTESELDFAAELAGFVTIWIGATDLATEGSFLYEHSGRPVPIRFWKKGEPNNKNGKEHCAEMFVDEGFQKFNDAPCTFYRSFICEK